MDSELAVGNFLMRQRELASHAKLVRSYDVVAAGLSWEDRATFCLSQLADSSTEAVLFKFRSRSTGVERAKMRRLAILRAILRNSPVKELGSSTETQANFRILKAWIQDLYTAAGRPLSILLDVTCIPKTYVLYLLGLGFTEELVGRLDCVYAPGIYDLMADNAAGSSALAGPRSILSEGERRSRQVPYLEAANYIANDSDLLVALGGELGLTLPFIECYEPRRLGLIFIGESSPASAHPMRPSERRAYEELLREPNAQHKDLPLCDAIAVASHALQFAGASSAPGITGMALGSKPHALGLGVASLANANMEVVCRTPVAYRPINVAASGKLMLYEIEDRFDPSSCL
jgi:hypothetical protein